MQKISKNKGITLVELVITIIVLIILAGVTIGLINGNDGILSKTKLAQGRYQNSANEENEKINTYENEIDKNTIDVASSRDDTIVLKKDEYNKLINANSYSLDEKEIGTWIDGKKLYRKCIIYDPKTITGGWKSLPLPIENINEIIKIYGYSSSPNGNLFKDLNANDPNSGNQPCIYVDKSQNIILYLQQNYDWTGKTCIILEYTKTTD